MTDENIGLKVIEIGGERLVARNRVKPDGSKDYSLDGGRSWWPSLIDAYNAAKAEGNLETEREDQDQFQAWTLALLQEIQSLQVGESLKIAREASTFLVLRERVVLACPAGAIREIDLRVEEGGEDVEGQG